MVTLADPIPEPTVGSTLMLSQNMVSLVSEILQQGGHRQTGTVQLCVDATYKISNSNWGLVICSISNKHVGPECKFAASEAIPIALGWIPKENQACLSAFLISMVEAYNARGISLRAAISSILVDGAKGTAEAIAQAGGAKGTQAMKCGCPLPS